MKFLITLIISSISWANMSHIPTLHWLEGDWKGTGKAVDVDFSWTITLNYKADEKTILLKYPSHNCGGSLKINSIETGRAQCIEDVNYGLGQCTSGYDVTILKQNDGNIQINYYYPNTKTLKSVATLTRI